MEMPWGMNKQWRQGGPRRTKYWSGKTKGDDDTGNKAGETEKDHLT
jgi:hypothetical protein